MKEIADAALDAEEENELVAKRKRMMNAEKISSAMSCVNESINGEGGAMGALSQAREALRGVIANDLPRGTRQTFVGGVVRSVG